MRNGYVYVFCQMHRRSIRNSHISNIPIPVNLEVISAMNTIINLVNCPYASSMFDVRCAYTSIGELWAVGYECVKIEFIFTYYIMHAACRMNVDVDE